MTQTSAAGSCLSALPLTSRGDLRRYVKGAVVLQEGDVVDAIYLVVTGSLKVFTSDLSDREFIYDICGPGQYVGAVGLDGGPSEASVMTLETTTCRVIRLPELRECIAAHPEFAYELLSHAFSQVRKARQQARSLALQDIYSRLSAFLTAQNATSSGALPHFSHQEIASQIGASREMVSRILRDLEQGGYVEKVGRRLVLKGVLPGRW